MKGIAMSTMARSVPHDRLARGAAAGFACVAGLAACAAMAAAETTLERIKRTGTVTVAVAEEAPYGYRDASGRITGEAPEIARVILARIDPNIEIVGVATDFGRLIGGLQDNEFDIAAAGMFITPQRCAAVAFSNPTYVIGEAFAVKRGNPKGLTDYVAISDNRDAKVGLISGTVEYNYALVTGIPADRALLYSNFQKALAALKSGEVDAVGLTSLSAHSLVAGDPSLEATPQFFPEIDGRVVKGYGGFAFRKQDRDLVHAFNRRLADFIGADEHRALVEAFGFGADMLPDKTAEELCRR
jgi:polar amino acid transport system substrate-binding protein